MPEPIPHWHVEATQVREDTTLSDSGSGLVHQWIVPYTIDDGPAKGQTFSVRVADRDFTPATVRQAITEHLSNAHGVATLSSRDA